MEKLVMRELRGDDLFTLIKIFEKLDVVDEIVELYGGLDVKDFTPEMIKERGRQVMTSLLSKIIKSISLIKPELNGFLGELTGKKSKEISELPLGQYVGLIKDFVAKEEFKDFLSSIA